MPLSIHILVHRRTRSVRPRTTPGAKAGNPLPGNANPLRHEHAIDLSLMSDKDLAELVRGGA
jgi:hypothetical protein